MVAGAEKKNPVSSNSWSSFSSNLGPGVPSTDDCDFFCASTLTLTLYFGSRIKWCFSCTHPSASSIRKTLRALVSIACFRTSKLKMQSKVVHGFPCLSRSYAASDRLRGNRKDSSGVVSAFSSFLATSSGILFLSQFPGAGTELDPHMFTKILRSLSSLHFTTNPGSGLISCVVPPAPWIPPLCPLCFMCCCPMTSKRLSFVPGSGLNFCCSSSIFSNIATKGLTSSGTFEGSISPPLCL